MLLAKFEDAQRQGQTICSPGPRAAAYTPHTGIDGRQPAEEELHSLPSMQDSKEKGNPSVEW
jgi:hypothetical protein